MKNTICYIVLFLLGLTMITSCGEKSEHKATENIIQKPTTEAVEEKQEDTVSLAFIVVGDDIDTVRHKDFEKR